MALPISNIPVLTGEVADTFIRKAEEVEKDINKIDMSAARVDMMKILSKARL